MSYLFTKIPRSFFKKRLTTIAQLFYFTDIEGSGDTEISSTMSSTLPSLSSTTTFPSTVPTSIGTDTITQISFETSQSSSIGENTISLTQFSTTAPSSTLTSMGFTEIGDYFMFR